MRADDEDRRSLVYVGRMAAPLADRGRADQLVGLQDVGRYGQQRVVGAQARQLVEQLQISVRSLDEQLRLSLGPGPLLEAADRLSPLGVLDGR